MKTKSKQIDNLKENKRKKETINLDNEIVIGLTKKTEAKVPAKKTSKKKKTNKNKKKVVNKKIVKKKNSKNQKRIKIIKWVTKDSGLLDDFIKEKLKNI